MTPTPQLQTDVKPEMIPGVYTGNGIPYYKYDVRGIGHAHTNRKDDIFMQRRLYIDDAHMVLNIFCTLTAAIFISETCLFHR